MIKRLADGKVSAVVLGRKEQVLAFKVRSSGVAGYQNPGVVFGVTVSAVEVENGVEEGQSGDTPRSEAETVVRRGELVPRCLFGTEEDTDSGNKDRAVESTEELEVESTEELDQARAKVVVSCTGQSVSMWDYQLRSPIVSAQQ